MAKPPFPNESAEYRDARNRLLEAEMNLRKQTEDVARLRRSLPLGGHIEQDYVFEENGPGGKVKQTRMSDLFMEDQTTLLVYGFMYGPRMQAPCPLCTSMLDGLNGNAEHIIQQMSLAVVARSPIQRIQDFASSRGWNHLRMISDAGNTFHADYFAEDEDGNQWPMANVFVKRGDAIHHFWGSELLFHSFENGDYRHVDSIWPLWNVLDFSPEGRGEKWYPSLSYDE